MSPVGSEEIGHRYGSINGLANFARPASVHSGRHCIKMVPRLPFWNDLLTADIAGVSDFFAGIVLPGNCSGIHEMRGEEVQEISISLSDIPHTLTATVVAESGSEE